MKHTTFTIHHNAGEIKKLLIVGLGNPDSEYENTLHNVGFSVLNRIAKEQSLDWKNVKSVQGEMSKITSDNIEIILLKPTTYMNRSGLAVKNALNFWKVNLNNLLVIQDDSDIMIGKLKIGFDQSSGGHKGIESIIQAVGSQKFSRLKLGVRPESLINSGKHVKAEKFILRLQSKSTLLDIASQGKEVVYYWINNGLEATMNMYNTHRS